MFLWLSHSKIVLWLATHARLALHSSVGVHDCLNVSLSSSENNWPFRGESEGEWREAERDGLRQKMKLTKLACNYIVILSSKLETDVCSVSKKLLSPSSLGWGSTYSRKKWSNTANINAWFIQMWHVTSVILLPSCHVTCPLSDTFTRLSHVTCPLSDTYPAVTCDMSH